MSHSEVIILSQDDYDILINGVGTDILAEIYLRELGFVIQGSIAATLNQIVRSHFDLPTMENCPGWMLSAAAPAMGIGRKLIPGCRTVLATLFGANMVRSNANYFIPMHLPPLNSV